MELRGLVVLQPYAVGSKSEHRAVCIESSQGLFKLRRVEGNPFSDPELNALVGSEIVGEGSFLHDTFLMTTWKKLDVS